MMKRVMETVAVFVAQALLLACPAFAAKGDVMTTATVRQENRTSVIRIEGTLTCNMGTQNSGEGCALKIREAKSGKTYDLANGNVAMRLFNSGSRNVAIEGSLIDAETISVVSAASTANASP